MEIEDDVFLGPSCVLTNVSNPKSQISRHSLYEKTLIKRGELTVEKLGRGFAWLDTGTHRSLIEAANCIQAIEERPGLKIACLEEIAWESGWIDRAQVERAATALGKSNYAEYLRFLLQTRHCSPTPALISAFLGPCRLWLATSLGLAREVSLALSVLFGRWLLAVGLRPGFQRGAGTLRP